MSAPKTLTTSDLVEFARSRLAEHERMAQSFLESARQKGRSGDGMHYRVIGDIAERADQEAIVGLLAHRVGDYDADREIEALCKAVGDRIRAMSTQAMEAWCGVSMTSREGSPV